MNTIIKIFSFLSASDRRSFFLLFFMILLMALLDMLGVASIMPFIAVLSNPQLIETNVFLTKSYHIAGSVFNVTTKEEFLFVFGVCIFILLIFSIAFKALTKYFELRFTLMREYSIGKRLISSYLHQPYSWFLNRNSSDLGSSILSEVGSIIHGSLIPLTNIVAQGSVTIALLSLLIFVDPFLAVIVGVTLSISYLIIYKLTSTFLLKIGGKRMYANQARYTLVSEAFGAAKEVKVSGLEQTYIDRFSDQARSYANYQASAQVVSQLPRFALEAIAFGGLIILVLISMSLNDNFTDALPVIALYAFAGYRLMPALQNIYASFTQLRFSSSALDNLYKDLASIKINNDNFNSTKIAMELKQNIKLNNIYYTYPNVSQPVLKDITLTIPSKSIVGIVGSTGSGKTTMVDIILGLLDSQQGILSVDGNPISDKNRRKWQKSIGYVPQQIYLADDTVAANIAFGVEKNNIDQACVERAAHIANLHSFIKNNLKQGYQTTVGERGVRLSGGQRQRIGIARALYHNPKLLVLDEATSALDNLTEQVVMEAINNLEGEMTIILIAHRLNTIRKCSIIFFLENGELKGQGSFDQLVKTNELFKKMAANY